MLRRPLIPARLLGSGVGSRPGLIGATLAYAVLIMVALLIGLPFFWMFVSSLKPLADVFDFNKWLPTPPQWQNYSNALQSAPFGRYLFNSSFSALAILLGQYLTIIPAAYGFSRISFPGRDLLFLLVLATMMVPIQVTFIPTFVIISRLGWKDTYWALIMPFITSGFGIFLLRQAFLQVAQDFVDAARLDGCDHFGVMRHVMVPLNGPTLITFGLFSFVTHFNDLFWPLVATDSDQMRTLPMGLASFIEFEGGTRWNELLAASLLGILPLIMLFLFAQRFFIKGVASTGLKG